MLHLLKKPAKSVRGDEGSALVLTMAVCFLLFTLATSLMALVTYRTQMSVMHESSTIGVHMADSGLNAYLYELRKDPNYFESMPRLGPQAYGEGMWVVDAVAPTETEPLTLYCTGWLPSRELTETIVATVRFPTFADYMFLSDAQINIGSHATIYGKIRSNRSIDNDGRVTGEVISASTVTGSGVFEQGYSEFQPVVDFGQVIADMDVIRQLAQDAGTHFPNSGSYGYHATVNGSDITVKRVVGGVTSGNLNLTDPVSVQVPASGVLFFEDDVWVTGHYDSNITIAGTGQILIPDEFERQNPAGKYTAGLIAEDDIVIPTWYPSMPDYMTVEAALLSQSGSIYGDLRYGTTRAKIVIDGSMAYSDYGYMAMYSGGTVVAGFRERDYQYDERLDLNPPPKYPVIKDGSLKVSTWLEQ